ncbi:MAG: restriction endonuclease subunit S [bacterium]|nr:restriction endonuclease subunit S [bacterium]
MDTKRVPKLRFSEFSGDWEEKRLGKVLKYEQPSKYIVQSTEYSENYSTPVLTAGKSFLLGYTNEIFGICVANQHSPIIIFDDFTTVYKFVDFNFKVKSSAIKILKFYDEKFNIKFVFEAMSTIKIKLGEDHKRYWISEYSYLKIPMPSLAEQQKIANFLSKIDAKIEKLEKEIDHNKEFKKGLLQ